MQGVNNKKLLTSQKCEQEEKFMMSLAYVLCIVLGTVIFFMGVQAVNTGWKRVIPKSYRITYIVLYVCYFVWSIYLARNILSNAIPDELILKKLFIASLLIGFVVADIIFIPSVLITRQGVIRKISFKNTLVYGFRKKLEKEYQKLNAEEFARQNNMDYISVIGGNRIENDEEIERIIAKENKYIKFYPYNDGYNYSPKKEWFGRFCTDGDVTYSMIMDTKKAFNCITNLKEILIQMIQLYWDSVEKDIYMDPYEFGLLLEEEPSEGYVGRAKLVMTADTIKNKKIEIDEKEKAKAYYLNRFLDCFIGWNFGAIINEDVELQIRLKQLNELVILKGLRSYRGVGMKLEFNDYIQKYRLDTTK